MQIVWEHREIMAVGAGFFLLGLLLRIIPGLFLRKLIRETDNMATTNNSFLRQCSMKYESIYKMNQCVPNTEAFVKRNVSRLTLFGCSLKSICRCSRQLILGFIFCVGLAICKSIALGKTIWDTSSLFLVSLAGLYCYFSMASIFSLDNCLEELRVCLVEYLENHLRFRIDASSEKKEEKDTGKEAMQDSKVSQEELEALLTEFLAM